MHSTRPGPPLVGCCCELPCVRSAVALPLIVLLPLAGLLVPEWAVVRRGRFKQRRVVRQREVGSDPSWWVRVLLAYRVAVD